MTICLSILAAMSPVNSKLPHTSNPDIDEAWTSAFMVRIQIPIHLDHYSISWYGLAVLKWTENMSVKFNWHLFTEGIRSPSSGPINIIHNFFFSELQYYSSFKFLSLFLWWKKQYLFCHKFCTIESSLFNLHH